MPVRRFRELSFWTIPMVMIMGMSSYAADPVNPPGTSSSLPPRPAPLLVVRIAPISTKITPTIQVEFSENNADLDTTAKKKIQDFMNQLKEKDAKIEVIVVVGHADPAEGGNAVALTNISAERANKARALIVGMGVEASRVYSTGVGDTKSGEAKPEIGNRRVVVEVVGTVQR